MAIWSPTKPLPRPSAWQKWRSAHRTAHPADKCFKTGGESGIRTRPFFKPSCYQGDGENPCKHGHSNTISFASYFSNVAPFNSISEFLELMELMHPFLSQQNRYADGAVSAAPRAVHKLGTMPGNLAHVAESFLRTSASFLNRDCLVQP